MRDRQTAARGNVAAWVGILLGLGGLTGCGSRSDVPQVPRETPNVVLVTIDTLRADHLGCYGYFRDTSPTLDRLARESVVFDRAYCPMATTLPSHLSLLTGLSPLEHGVLANQEHGGATFRSRPGVRSIAQILRDRGYATAAFVSAAPVKRSSGIAAGFDTFVEPNAAQCRAEDTTRAALEWIAEHADRRTFVWIHYYDPHWPREPPEPYASRYADEPALEGFLAERRVPDFVGRAPCKLATDTRQATNAYDGAIRYVDDQLRIVLDALGDRGLLERSVIVVTADHGEGLNQHDWPAHGRVWNEQLRVPLLVRFPPGSAERPRRVESVVSLIDVFPTLVSRLDLPGAQEVVDQASGVDVLAVDFSERPVVSQRTGRECGDRAGPLFAWTTGRWKYVHRPAAGARLFDLANDPFELRDVLAARPDVGATLRGGLVAAIERETARGERLRDSENGDDRALDPVLREQLESLGYVGAGSTTEPGE